MSECKKLSVGDLVRFSPKKIAFNMEVLQEYDLKSKGYGNTSSSQADLMKEMIFKLLNP